MPETVSLAAAIAPLFNCVPSLKPTRLDSLMTILTLAGQNREVIDGWLTLNPLIRLVPVR